MSLLTRISAFNVGPQDRMLALTALNHDLSVYDIFGLLCAGGTIVIPDASAVKDPSHWSELMVRERITLWNSVPAMMEMLVDYAEGQSVVLPDSLRLVILGGDWLPVSLPNRLRALVPGVQILSIGGPHRNDHLEYWLPDKSSCPQLEEYPLRSADGQLKILHLE